jgi:hypothetical protein
MKFLLEAAKAAGISDAVIREVLQALCLIHYH